MNPTVGGDVDVQAATRDLMVNDQVTADGTSKAQEPLPPEATNHQVVVGDIPMEPSCFQSRAGLLAELDRAGAQVSVIHSVTGQHGLGATQLAAAYARAKLAAGWRLVAWVNGADTGSLLADWLQWLTPRDWQTAIPGRASTTRVLRCVTGWRLTGTDVFWCSTTCPTLRSCARMFRSAVQPGY